VVLILILNKTLIIIINKLKLNNKLNFIIISHDQLQLQVEHALQVACEASVSLAASPYAVLACHQAWHD